MNTSTQKSPAALANYDLQSSYATVYAIPERPRTRAPKLPFLRYEDCPMTNVSDADEKYCLTGYGEISISEHYDVAETGEDDQKLRVPRLRHVRPRARRQPAKAVSNSVSESDLGGPSEPLLMSDVRQLKHEHFRKTIQTASKNLPDTPSTDFREFFENLLRKPPLTRRKNRTPILSTSVASEAVDARPHAN